MFFYKEMQLILSRIEFSLLVRPSTTLPLSHVAPWGNELPTPALEYACEYALEYACEYALEYALEQGFPTHGPRPIGGPPSTIQWATKMFQVFFFFHEFSTKNGFLVENNIN